MSIKSSVVFRRIVRSGIAMGAFDLPQRAARQFAEETNSKLGHPCEEFENRAALRVTGARTQKVRYGVTGSQNMRKASKMRKPKRKAARTESRNQRLEKALEEGLQETFPASDAVSVTEPAGPRPLSDRATRKRA
jgi:hypothetical protein